MHALPVLLILIATAAEAGESPATTHLHAMLAALADDAKRAVRAERTAEANCGPGTRVRADEIKGEGTYLIGRPASGLCTARRLAAKDLVAGVQEGVRHAIATAKTARVPPNAIRTALRHYRLQAYETPPTKKPASMQSGREIAEQLLYPAD